MSNRSIFAILGIAAVAAIIGLVFLVRGDDAPAATTTGSAGSAAPRSGFAGPQHGPAGGKPLAPPSLGSADVPPNREYSSNGVIVHDHRTGTHEPYQANPGPTPENGGRRLQPTLTKAVADRVRDVMHECVKTLPEGARGEK